MSELLYEIMGHLSDTSDYELVKPYRWTAKNDKHTIYVHGRVNGRTTTLHTFLMPDVEIVDHKDWNGLNNRRSNLRSLNPSQSSKHRRPRGTAMPIVGHVDMATGEIVERT